MRMLKLYLCMLASVLLLLGCGEDVAEPSTRAAADREDTSEQPRATNRATDKQSERTPVIVAMGNSITAGYGLNPNQAFPALLQQKIDSLGWNYQVINAGVSGETSAGGLSRIDWLLQRPVDVLIVELGGNDMLRGIPTDVTKQNLKGIIERTRERYPDTQIILAGMEALPSYGLDYVREFRAIYQDLAREENVLLVPFILQGVGGIAELNQDDGIHPTAQGHRIVARNVWEVLRPTLESMQDAPA
jgi:acyl-CoA thioesterase-1